MFFWLVVIIIYVSSVQIHHNEKLCSSNAYAIAFSFSRRNPGATIQDMCTNFSMKKKTRMAHKKDSHHKKYDFV